MTDASPSPLTIAEQQALASAPRHLAFARKIARRLCERRPWLYDEYEAAAFMGLVEAARTFDPRRGYKFATHAAWRIHGAISDYRRERGMKGFRKGGREEKTPTISSIDRDAPSPYGATAFSRFADCLVADDEPVGWEAEWHDELKAISRRLPGRHGMALRLIYLHAACQKHKDAGKVMRVSEGRVSQIHKAIFDAFGAGADR